jgi:hypothetical protein
MSSSTFFASLELSSSPDNLIYTGIVLDGEILEEHTILIELFDSNIVVPNPVLFLNHELARDLQLLIHLVKTILESLIFLQGIHIEIFKVGDDPL